MSEAKGEGTAVLTGSAFPFWQNISGQICGMASMWIRSVPVLPAADPPSGKVHGQMAPSH